MPVSKNKPPFTPIIDTGFLRAHFLRFFILACLFWGFWIFVRDFLLIFEGAANQQPSYLAETLAGCLGLGGLYVLNQRGRTDLAGYLFIGLWMIGIIGLTDLANLDQKLILYGLPIAGASFILPSNRSFAAAGLASILYSVAYFAGGARVPYNYFFVIAIYMYAAAAWFISENLNKALKAVRKSEKLYLDMIEHAPSVNYVITGTHTCRIIYVNPRIYNLLGFTPQEWSEKPETWFLQLHPDDREWVLKEWSRTCTENVPFKAEYRIHTKNGKTIWISDEAVPIQEPGETDRIQGMMLDVTQRRRSEEIQAVLYQLAQSANSAQDLPGLFSEIHRALGSLLHAENFFIALYDPADDTVNFPYYVDQVDEPPLPQKAERGLTEYVLRSGKPLLASPEKFEKMVNDGEVQAIGAASVDWLGVPLKIGERTIGVMALQSYTEGIRFSLEDLDLLTFVSNQAARLIERKRAEEDLRISEKIYRTTIDSLEEMIHVEDPERRILMVNNSFVQRNEKHGLPVELVGKKFEEVFPYLDQKILSIYYQIFEDGQKRAMINERQLSGKTYIYDSEILPVFEGERVVRSITVLRDITAKKQAEDQIKAALQEKEVLLREIHHRVKNNLQVMSSLLSLQADFIQDPHTLDLFRETQARMRSMALIHEELYQSDDLAKINYADYIEKLTSNLLQAFNQNPFVQMNLEIDEVYLNIDTAIPCGLIINELVTNAIKYAFPEGKPGTITIRLIKNRLESNDNGFTLEISDDGIGIPDTLNISETETLGLQLVQILVNQLKGSLVVESKPGACFTIQFREK
jgi:PAS domain S-box-containing protein